MKSILAGLLIFFSLNALCQGDFYLYNKQWKQVTKPEEATYFARRLQVNDTAWKWDVYNFAGPLIATQHFKDRDLTQKNGYQYYYHPSGYMDSTGNVVNGEQEGEWNFFNDTGNYYLKKIYNKGVLTSSEPQIDRSRDTTKIEGERESSFTGGIKQWQRYLIKNMRYPERALNLRMMGLVVTSFTVDAVGKVSGIFIFKSAEFSLDEEAMRLIEKSPKWEPAWQKDKYVKSYKRQPLQYRLE